MKGNRIAHTALATAFLMVLLAGLALAQDPAGTPLGTAFTYQGQLKSDDAPHTGTCDIKFGLFDVSTGGTAISTLTKTNVPVYEGYFTVQLDYGSGQFAGDKRWLEMSVRCPAGSGSYTLLSPRQEVTASPYALHAVNADLLDGQHASGFSAAGHGHWGAAWSGSGTGLSLSGGSIGLDVSGTDKGVYGRSYAEGGMGVYGQSDAEAGTGVGGHVTGWGGTGVSGLATHPSGFTVGVRGQSQSTDGIGVEGSATTGTGYTFGVRGVSSSSDGRGVFGGAYAYTGATYGVHGQSLSTEGTGVYGEATAGTGYTNGVRGTSASTGGMGVVGLADADTGSTYGIYGRSDSSDGTGVKGYASATNGTTYGVYGQTNSTNGRGVFGDATALSGTSAGVLGRASTGVSWGTVGWNAINGAGVGAWSQNGDLIQALAGDFPGGTLRFKVDQNGNVHLDGSLIYFGELRSPAGGEPAKVQLYGLAGTEVWAEELGSGTLVEGRAQVTIDPVFAQSVALTESYRVYLTATCQEPVLLFVSEKAPDHFTVQGVGLDGQPSSCGFDYRLAAKRLGYQDLRLEPVDVPAPVEVERESQP